jgi:hypothetical protein
MRLRMGSTSRTMTVTISPFLTIDLLHNLRDLKVIKLLLKFLGVW